jgi:hypothetical protein
MFVSTENGRTTEYLLTQKKVSKMKETLLEKNENFKQKRKQGEEDQQPK